MKSRALKSVLVGGLVFVLVFAFVGQTLAQVFTASDDFSETQGFQNWYYLDWTGTQYEEMTFGTNWWGYPSWHGNSSCYTAGIDSVLNATGGHPNICGYAPTRAWASPTDGFVQITGNTRKGDAGGGDGVEVEILKNGELLWSATIAFNDTIGYDFNLSQSVVAEDVLYFRIHPLGNPYYDTTYFNPTITLATNIKIAIDIKPGFIPNSINPKSNGKIPVAILTTDTFDAATVDAVTVRLGVKGTEAAPVQSALEDVDGDGDTDIILHFNTQGTGIVCGDSYASLTGKTFGGEMISGTDFFQTVGCR